jgi:hypothetical protein
MKIELKADIDENKLDCNGEVEILSISPSQAYISWSIYNILDNSRIAGVSKNYLIESDYKSKEEIIGIVLKDILKYRIGRKKVFSDILLIK